MITWKLTSKETEPWWWIMCEFSPLECRYTASIPTYIPVWRWNKCLEVPILKTPEFCFRCVVCCFMKPRLSEKTTMKNHRFRQTMMSKINLHKILTRINHVPFVNEEGDERHGDINQNIAKKRKTETSSLVFYIMRHGFAIRYLRMLL